MEHLCSLRTVCSRALEEEGRDAAANIHTYKPPYKRPFSNNEYFSASVKESPYSRVRFFFFLCSTALGTKGVIVAPPAHVCVRTCTSLDHSRNITPWNWIKYNTMLRARISFVFLFLKCSLTLATIFVIRFIGVGKYLSWDGPKKFANSELI